jgi:hypothetical protein
VEADASAINVDAESHRVVERSEITRLAARFSFVLIKMEVRYAYLSRVRGKRLFLSWINRHAGKALHS